jgi:hypothetical protein
MCLREWSRGIQLFGIQFRALLTAKKIPKHVRDELRQIKKARGKPSEPCFDFESSKHKGKPLHNEMAVKAGKNFRMWRRCEQLRNSQEMPLNCKEWLI